MIRKLLLFILLYICICPGLWADNITAFEVNVPSRTVGPSELQAEILLLSDEHENDTVMFIINGKRTPVEFTDGVGAFYFNAENNMLLSIRLAKEEEGQVFEKKIKVLPHWLSLLPPVIAIFLALVFREVITSLFIGIFSGLLLLTGFYPWHWAEAIFRFADTYLIRVLTDADKVSIIVFSFFIGGMVHLISKNGGCGEL